MSLSTRLTSPALKALPESNETEDLENAREAMPDLDIPEQAEADVRSDCGDDGSSVLASELGAGTDSVVNSQVGNNSVLSESRHSVGRSTCRRSMDYSAFTAPPKYRNSGAFVHGTKFKNFTGIMQEGLKVVKTEIFMIDEVRGDGRVPGLKDPPEILIFIDEQKARSHNITFDYVASEGSWKTKGINGVIRPWFFQKVVDQRRGPGNGNVIFQSKHDPVMLANKIPGAERPKFLMHATYWENFAGIMREGILPAKNPTSELRAPFKDLLQGAEEHVYTIKANRGLRIQECDSMPSSHGITRSLSEGAPSPTGKDLQKIRYTVEQDQCMLDRPPDAIIMIDVQAAEKMGVKLGMIQSTERDEMVYVQGPVPKEILGTVKPNVPVDLPESLMATIVNPESFEDIPVIDISRDEKEVIEQLRYACEVVGFMQVIGHGVSEKLQERLLKKQMDFFALPEEVKRRLELDKASPVRGYFGKGGEDLDQVLEKQVDEANGKKIEKQGRKDKKEALDLNGVPWSKPQGGYVARIFGQPSRLPEETVIHGFKEVAEEYSAAMFRLAQRILQLMAVLLDLPRDFFEQHLTNPVATHRLLHYWPMTDFQNEIGVGEHTDYGLLTILKQDSVGGLQVLNAKDGHWVHCCPINNAFVVNMGDMLARWTDHKFKSTIHRVVNTSGKERYSVPYFLEPNMDSKIVVGGILKRPEGGEEPSRPDNGQEVDTAEDILGRFYRASGQLKYQETDSAEGAPQATESSSKEFVPPPRGFKA
jgi:isopenicillin N synthase-like dioxygenase/RNA:NAD 2'-phosphotransferase (TPT1/KptA family)